MKRIALILSILVLFSFSLFAVNTEQATPKKQLNAKLLPSEVRNSNETTTEKTILGETVIYAEDFESGAMGWFMDGGYATDGGDSTVQLHDSRWEISEVKSSSPTHSLFHPDEFPSSRDFVFSSPFVIPEELGGDPVVSAKLSFMLNIDNPGYGDPNNPGYLGDYFMVWAGVGDTSFSIVDIEGGKAYYSGYPEANSFQYLTSPTIDLTAATAPVTLDFDALMINEKHWDLGRVDILVDGEDGYTTVAQIDSNGVWETTSIDISNQVGNVIQVRFSFLPDYGYAEPDGGLWIDNIKVSDATGDLFMDDAEEGNAVMEASGITLARLFYDYDRVQDGGADWNLWDESVLFNGTADLFDLGIQGGDEVWLAVSFIADGDNTQGEEESAGIFFDDFMVTAISGVPADAGVSNLVVGYPQTAGQPTQIAATVSNFGFEAQSIPLWYKVGDDPEMPVPPYLELDAFTDTTRVFGTTLPEADSTAVIATTKLPGDMVPENDAMGEMVYLDPPGVATFNYTGGGFKYFSTSNRITLFDPLAVLEGPEKFNLESINIYMYNAAGAEDVVNMKVYKYTDDPLTPTDVVLDTNVTFAAAGGVTPVTLPVDMMDMTGPFGVWLDYSASGGAVGLLLDGGTPFAGNDLVYSADDEAWFLSGLGHFIFANITYSVPPPIEETYPDIVRANHPPAIDGVLDDIWEMTPWYREYNLQAGAENVDNFMDAALAWRAMYDDNYLYLMVNINDETFVRDSGNDTWKDDGVEIWLDGDNSKGTSYDGVNDWGFKFIYSGDPDDPFILEPVAPSGMGPEGDFSGIKQGAIYTDFGLNLEIAFPLDLLGITPTPGYIFGLELDYNDDDDGGERDTKVKYFSMDDNSWQNPSTFGTVELIDRTVFSFVDIWWTDAEPVIDGQADDFLKDLPSFPLNHYMNVVDSLNSYNDMAMEYKVAWDSSRIYYFVSVTDDVLLQEGAYNWTDDSIELWFDGDNSKLPKYDGVNDFGLFFGIGMDAPIDSVYFHTISDGHVVLSMDAVDWAASYTDDGIFLEFSLPLDSIGVMPKNGWKLAHELDYNDSDTPGLTRDTKCKTYAEQDNTWGDPRWTATGVLLGGPGAPIMPVKPVPVVMTDVAPIIDGEWEAAWENVPNWNIAKSVATDPDNWWDSFGLARVSWDKKNLYVFVAVHDDSIVTDHGNPWERDSIELYFDGDNSKNPINPDDEWSPNYDDNDDQVRFVFGQEPTTMMGNIDLTDVEYATVEADYGWNLEVKIPLSALPEIVGKPGKVFGFEMQLNDNDGTQRDHNLKWYATNDNGWRAPAEFGTVILDPRVINEEAFPEKPVLHIPFTTYPIEIDAEYDYGWKDALPIFGNYRFNEADSVSSPEDVEVKWKALWDYDYLYLMVKVKDDILLQEGSYGWQDDGIEMWWDGDASQLSEYGDANDLSFHWSYDPDQIITPIANWRGGLDSLALSSFMQAQKLTDDGLLLEVAMPWDVLGTDVGDGALVALEIDYNDSDTPGLNRDTKVKSYDPTDGTWGNPSLMGLARLVGSRIESDVEDNVEIVTTYELRQNYPNPFNPSTHIEFAVPVDGKVKLVIYDVLGREVVTLLDQKMEAGKHSLTFDASKYASGVYFYSLQTSERTITKKMMLLK